MLGLGIIFLITLAAFLLVIGLMAIGVMLGRREISGSCGGLNQGGQGQGGGSCDLCSNPEAACRELKRRMNAEPESAATASSAACTTSEFEDEATHA